MLRDYKKAVILAGGKGTRLYPITYEIPKPLLPVNKKPIINYLVDLFLTQKVEEIAVLVSQEFKDDFYWWQKRYYPDNNFLLVEEKEPLGTFGGLYLLKDWLKNGDFFMTNGDELKKIDLVEMGKFHSRKPGLATVALVEVPNPQDYGVAICEQEMIKEFLEKPENPPSKYISSGLYLLSPHVLQNHPGAKFSMIEKDLFPKLAKNNQLAGFKFRGKWTDCGTWDRYSQALKNWK